MKIGLKPIYRDILLTALTELAVILFFFLLFRLLAAQYGPEGVGKFSLVKRVANALLPFSLFGLVVGLPRCLSLTTEPRQQSAYILAGSLIVACLTAVVLAAMLLGTPAFARVFLGSESHQPLVFPLSLLFLGTVAHTLVYSILRGRMRFLPLNALSIINLGLAPVALVLGWPGLSLEGLISLMGLVMLLLSLGVFVLAGRDCWAPGAWQGGAPLRELLAFSFPRFVASFLHTALYSLTVVVAAHYVSLTEVGYLSVGQNLLSVVGSGLAPLLLILLPKVGSMLAENREAEVQENLNLLLGASIQAALFLGVQLIIFADVIILSWLGPGFAEAVAIARLILLAILGYVITGPLSSFLEASQFKPYVLYNILIGLAALLLATFGLLALHLCRPVISLGLGFVAGISGYGVGMYVCIRRLFPERWQRDLAYLVRGLVSSILLGGLTMLLRFFLPDQLPVLLGLGLAMALCYLALLWAWKTDWLLVFVNELRVKSS